MAVFRGATKTAIFDGPHHECGRPANSFRPAIKSNRFRPTSCRAGSCAFPGSRDKVRNRWELGGNWVGIRWEKVRTEFLLLIQLEDPIRLSKSDLCLPLG